MERWEYLEAFIQGAVRHDSSGRTEKLEQVRVPLRGTTGQYAAIAPLLNELREEGWELAGVAALENPYPSQKLYLKRPRQ